MLDKRLRAMHEDSLRKMLDERSLNKVGNKTELVARLLEALKLTQPMLMEKDLEKMKVPDLRKMLEERNLQTEGEKRVLIKRLVRDDVTHRILKPSHTSPLAPVPLTLTPSRRPADWETGTRRCGSTTSSTRSP